MGSYRYGFNGMKKDDEVKGSSGSSYDFGARIYDPRIGRWSSLDPAAKNYPDISDYSFVLGNPIKLTDPTGKVVVNPDSESAQYIKAQLERTDAGKIIWQQMVESKNMIEIHVTKFTEHKDDDAGGVWDKSGECKFAFAAAANGSLGFVGRTEIIDRIIEDRNDYAGLSAQVEGGTFNSENGEYDFEEGLTLYLVIDLDLINGAVEMGQSSGKTLEEFTYEIIVEESVHSTQTYTDFGKFYRKQNADGSYSELSPDELESIQMNMSMDDWTENYNSQRNEIDAKQAATEAAGELKE